MFIGIGIQCKDIENLVKTLRIMDISKRCQTTINFVFVSYFD